MEDPGGSELVDICGVDFPQSAITAPRVVAVVGGPIRSHRTRQQIFGAYRAGGDYRTFLPRQWDANQHGEKSRTTLHHGTFISANFPCPDRNFLKCASIQSTLIFQM